MYSLLSRVLRRLADKWYSPHSSPPRHRHASAVGKLGCGCGDPKVKLTFDFVTATVILDIQPSLATMLARLPVRVRAARLQPPLRLSARLLCTSPTPFSASTSPSASSGGRRAIPLPLDSPVPDCHPPAPAPPPPPSSPLDLPPPPGSEPLPYPSRGMAARRSLLLFDIPVPPSKWPSHLDFASPLLSEAGAVLKRAGVAVNAVYDGVGDGEFPAPSSARDRDLSSSTNTDADSSSPSTPESVPAETYPARLIYPDGTVYPFPSFNEATLDSPQLRRALMHRSSPDAKEPVAQLKGEPEVLVCTHGSRDCRCSDHGGPLVEALRREGVSVKEIAHVGGHK